MAKKFLNSVCKALRHPVHMIIYLKSTIHGSKAGSNLELRFDTVSVFSAI